MTFQNVFFVHIENFICFNDPHLDYALLLKLLVIYFEMTVFCYNAINNHARTTSIISSPLKISACTNRRIDGPFIPLVVNIYSQRDIYKTEKSFA